MSSKGSHNNAFEGISSFTCTHHHRGQCRHSWSCHVLLVGVLEGLALDLQNSKLYYCISNATGKSDGLIGVMSLNGANNSVLLTEQGLPRSIVLDTTNRLTTIASGHLCSTFRTSQKHSTMYIHLIQRCSDQ